METTNTANNTTAHSADHSCGPTCPVGYFARKAEREAASDKR